MPSSAKDDLAKGGLYNDIDLTFTNCRFEEREKTTGGLSPVALFVSDVEMMDASIEELTWEVAPVAWFNDEDSGEPRCFVDDGKLLDVDGQRPYEISKTSEYGMLSNSLEDKGISSGIMQRLCAEPELLNGVKIHAKRESGRSYVAKKGPNKGKTVNWEVLVADRLIEDPNTDGKNRKKPVASKPAPAAARPAAGKAAATKPAGRRSAPVAAPDPEPEELSDIDVAGIDVVLTVLSDPKANGVRTYSARQNNGGVTLSQMATAAMTTYKGKSPSKNDVVSVVRDADWAGAHQDDADGAAQWTFDPDKGLYFATT